MEFHYYIASIYKSLYYKQNFIVFMNRILYIFYTIGTIEFFYKDFNNKIFIKICIHLQVYSLVNRVAL